MNVLQSGMDGEIVHATSARTKLEETENEIRKTILDYFTEFLIEIMPVMFIPAGVGLLTAWGVLKPVCVPIILIVVITTVVVMIVTGRVTQAVIRMDRKKGQKKS